MRLDDDDMSTSGSGGMEETGGMSEGPADGGASPVEQDGGADGAADQDRPDQPAEEGPADGGASPAEQDGGADGSAA